MWACSFLISKQRQKYFPKIIDSRQWKEVVDLRLHKAFRAYCVRVQNPVLLFSVLLFLLEKHICWVIPLNHPVQRLTHPCGTLVTDPWMTLFRFQQCWGSVTFGADPYLWLMDPDPDPTPDLTNFFIDFKDANYFSSHFFSYNLPTGISSSD